VSPPAWTHTAFAQQLTFGYGALGQLPDVIRTVGARRLLLVTTAGRLASPEGQRVVSALGRSLASTFDGVRSHLPTSVVQAALLQARRDGIDGVVSFGGGSAIDLGKAIVFFTEQEAGTPGSTYLDRPALPHIAIPVTYSGAEATRGFGMTDERTRTKGGGGGPTSTPVAVVYDPELTLTTPIDVTAETSLNALAHCVEAAYAIHRSPEAEAIALAGAARLHAALPAVIDDAGNIEARTELLAGAALAGRALQNATMGVHHGLAQQLGGRTGIPHGLANALLLPHAIRFNEPVVPEAVAALAGAMGVSDAAAAVEALRDRAGLPSRLRDVGVTEDDLDAIARLSQGNPNVQRNPRPVSEDEARALLAAAY
jgi:maleylacetate reductase